MMRIEKLRIGGGEGPFGAREMFDDELLAFAGDLDDDDDDDDDGEEP